MKEMKAVQEALLAAEVLDEKFLRKLHHVYGHTSAEKLGHFLEKTGRGSKEITKMLESIAKGCEACQKSKPPGSWT